jgi:hypothetical protein
MNELVESTHEILSNNKEDGSIGENAMLTRSGAGRLVPRLLELLMDEIPIMTPTFARY